jgi:predicted Rossmann fold flavoprotein
MRRQVAIIGGGAAGVFCAIQLRELSDCQVTIFEKSTELLKKVRISGGGRCNVTHHFVSQAQFSKNYPRGSKVLKQNFDVFSPVDMTHWLEKRGVRLKTEADGRVFPVSNDSQTIIDCFIKELKKHNVAICFEHELTQIVSEDHKFVLKFNDKTFTVDYLVIATGGAQKTRDLDIFKPLTLKMVDPVPSLFTFKINDKALTELMGLTMQDVSIRIVGTDMKESGSVLITHWGLSGPGILKLSAWGAFLLNQCNYHFQIAINWMGDSSEEGVRNEIEILRQESRQAKVRNRKIEKFPQRFWEYLLVMAEIEADKKWSELSKKNCNKLIQLLFHSVYEIKGKTTFKEEFVTAGGIDLDDLNPRTMESKKIPNLYFIGEVTNIDGITGGFNFQNAWTSATVCAKDISNKI